MFQKLFVYLQHQKKILSLIKIYSMSLNPNVSAWRKRLNAINKRRSKFLNTDDMICEINFNGYE